MLSAVAMASSGCDDDCVEDLSTDCTPLYEPTFAEVHARTLQPSCAVSGGACHSAEGRKGGLVLENIDEAYDALLDDRVSAGDAACSEVVVRLHATDGDVMPPGAPLGDAERCSIAQWIANGAAR